MPLSDELKSELSKIISSNDVVLFMKGSRHFPQCGFSATVVQILDKLVPKYHTVNVLSDPNVREGIKEYSQWPTIPQLYVRGQFVGGCDIVKEMFANGELHELLGAAKPEPPKAPAIALSDAAAKAFIDASGEMGDDVLRLEIDDRFHNDLFFGPKKPGDVTVSVKGVTIHVDAATAARANGVAIDFVATEQGGGFKITNPNEPARVKPLSVGDLKAMHDRGETLELVDVRTDGEREIAKIDWAKPLDQEERRRLLALPKDAKVVFMCHHGVRSRQAAEQFLREGFTNVWNLEGGIDAWSTIVDPSVRRY